MEKLSDGVKNLSKMQICYQLMYMTDGKTKAIQDVIKALKLYMRKVLTNQESLYREAEKYQIKLYEDAWKLCFDPSNGHVIEIGTILSIVYESIDPKEAAKMIGSKKMDKAVTSYYLATEEAEDELAVETRSSKFGHMIVKMYDGEKQISPFKRMMNIKKQNHVVETGENWDEFKQRKDIRNS